MSPRAIRWTGPALGVLGLLLSGCLDFTAAKLACFDGGGCKSDMVTPPSIVTTTPTNGRMNVKVSDALVVTFSREMDRSTVTMELTPPDGLAPPEWDDGSTTALFVPAVPLRYATMYTVRINGAGALDRAQLKEHIFSFTTESAPDMVAPSLVSSLPMNAAMSVAVTATLQLDFSEAMDRDSLSVISNPPRDFGMPTWMGNSQTVRFLTAPMPFEALTDYTLAIDATDVAGNPLSGTGTIVFTTGPAPDTTAPTVVSMSPPAGTPGVSINTNISISFSEPVKPAVTQALVVTPVVPGLPCVLDTAGVLMTCDPPMNLQGDAGYTVRLRSGADGGTGRVEDLAGNVMAVDFIGTFATSAAPDTTAPMVVSFTPDAGALGQPRNPLMRVTFSEPMDKAATQGALVVSSPNAITGTYSWDLSGRTVTFTPTPPQGGFAYGTTISWQVGTGARDLAGNTLPVTQQYTFRVVREFSATLTATAADGYLREVGVTRTAFPTSTYSYAGDTSTNDAYKTFLYFDFASLPTNIIRVQTASLGIHIVSRIGDPKGSLGGWLTVESIPWVSPFGSAQWSVAPIPSPCIGFCFANVFTDDSGGGRRTAYVTGHVSTALSGRRVLFRLAYPQEEDNDSDYDYVYIRTSEALTVSERPTLTIEYEAP